MKKMSAMLLCFAAMLLVSPSFAEDAPDKKAKGRGKGKTASAAMMEKLAAVDLTAEQKTKIESLGKELGVFTDPYQWYGRLSDEQLRAMRLVVDTGLHHFGWTRQQAIDYMLANSSMAESDVVAEVERYIVIPGQALAYKVGKRVIRELREEAERELGDRFDVRAFHREVLTDGALPMDVLQGKIRAWIAAEKNA